MREEAGGGCTKSTTITESATAETGAIRIHIGGLGGTVTADDLKKTFSAPYLGTVIAVDVIRTKGRNFAYLDFLPSSDKGLAKLFSSYNGCMWKGGRLRLEKAKEHYLIRLKREREEVAQHASRSSYFEADAVENIHSPDKPKKLPNMEKMQLQIFFPKLRKVKSIPFKGTGKHKYSFQRVDSPHLPTHFCDCEEHSGAVYVDRQQESSNHFDPEEDSSFPNHENESGGINEEELNVMKSVMNKLFERENYSKVTKSKAGFSEETSNIINRDNDSQFEDQEDQVSDEDGLIINLVSGSHNTRSCFRNPSGTDQDLFFKDSQSSGCRPVKEMHGSQKRLHLHSTEMSKWHNEREDDDTDIVCDIPGRKRRKLSATEEKKKKTPLDGQLSAPIPDTSDICLNSFDSSVDLRLKRPNSKSPWLQKSAWKNLVHGTDNNSFHISDISPSEEHGTKAQSASDNVIEPCISVQENLKDAPPRTEEPKAPVEASPSKAPVEASPSNANVLADKVTKGAAWLQKSSWTQLVGDSNLSTFSISQIIPNVVSDNHEFQPPPSSSIDFSRSRNNSRQNHVAEVAESQRGTNSGALADDNTTVYALTTREANNQVVQSNAGTDLQMDMKSNIVPAKSSRKNQSVTEPEYADVDETFTFMRSAASMREWTKIKAALSKKKGNQK